jgi:acyl-CoA dehydrogenase
LSSAAPEWSARAATPAFLDTDELRIFRRSVAAFFDRHATPAHLEAWREAGVVERGLWTAAAEAGLLGVSVPEQYGGAGGDFRHEAVIIEEMGRRGLEGFNLTLQNAVIAQYLVRCGSDAQRQRWLPKLACGEVLAAMAMTEPAAGSDLQGVRTLAERQGSAFRVNGHKLYVSNAVHADLILVVCKTDPAAGHRGVSVLLVESSAPGVRRGRKPALVGREAQDAIEVTFEDVAVPAENLLGEQEGRGFHQLMEQLPQERLILALQGAAMIERALGVTLPYVKQREAFGRKLLDFQNTQFRLAECKTEATVARSFVDACLGWHLDGALDGVTASMAKYWVAKVQCEIVDACLQLFGGYGYMLEYPIAHMFRDARAQRIQGGSDEIMKLLIARSL